ncbi:MAG TPA: hypothetical protein V6C64_07135, partial [Microcoleaceae cyanobacterium]
MSSRPDRRITRRYFPLMLGTGVTSCLLLAGAWPKTWAHPTTPTWMSTSVSTVAQVSPTVSPTQSPATPQPSQPTSIPTVAPETTSP